MSAGAWAFSVSPASRTDVGELLPLMQEFYAGERLPWDESVLRGALDELWEQPLHGAVWLARAAGEAIGYGVLGCGFSLEHRGRDAFVDELYVRPGWRSRGVGGRILDVMEAACGEQGISALHLEVDHDNARGKRLYRRRGFDDHGRHLMTRRLDR